MISIIKIITDNHRPFQLGFITIEERVNKIKSAQDRIIYCGNTISEAEASALIDKHVNGGLQNVSIFLSSKCCAWAKTREDLRALGILLNAEVLPNLKYAWGSNLLVVDKESYIFGEEIDTADIVYNCFTLDLGETETLIKSIFKTEEIETIHQESPASSEAIAELRKELKRRDEDLLKKQRYEILSSRIEFVTCHLEGVRLLNKTIQLNCPLFVFSSKHAKNKFKATYRLFDKFEHKEAFSRCFSVQREIQENLSTVKKKFLKNTTFGDCILCVNKEVFSKEVEEFNKKLVGDKKRLSDDLKLLLDDSINTLKSLLKEFAEKRIIQIKEIDYYSSIEKEGVIDQILKSLDVPTAEILVSRLRVDYWYTRLSPELCEKKAFLDQIKEKFEPELSGYQGVD